LTELSSHPLVPDPLPPARAWRIHLGAHKTATTHLQQTLGTVRLRLAARGVDFIPHDALRKSEFARKLNQRLLASRIPGLRRRAICDRVERLIRPLRTGPETVVISEEKLIGSSRHLFDDPVYPMLDRIVTMFAQLAGPESGVSFFLSVRSFERHLASAYAQELRVLPPPEDGFEAIRRRVVAAPPRWSDLVRRIRRAAPGAPVRVWRHEDYPAHRKAILSTLCGCDVGSLPEIPVPLSTKSPSLAGVRAAEALPRDLDPVSRRALVEEIYAAHQQGPSFRPFSQEEENLLRAAYEADLAEIARLGPDILVQPHEEAVLVA
jgi:hypothetical protein